MSWDALARLDIRVRPLSRPIPCAERYSQFRASFGSTVKILARELAHLDAKLIVVEADYRERDLRLDGLPRADAKMVSDALALAFESRYGPLRCETGEYDHWTDNLRAIALSMESLRAVDRYGVSKRGEQYTGWRAIPATTGGDLEIVTVDQALAALAPWGGDWKAAVRDTHPDTNPGSDPATFRIVMRAKEVLDAAA